MRRRDFITLLGGAAAAWPPATRAQQPALPVVGFLFPGALEPSKNLVAAFRKGLRERGYIEGHNVTIKFRTADGQLDRLPAMAADLVHDRVAVIFANGPGAIAAHAATTSIPIVFQIALDPVQLGLVASLNRPGGNLTGATSLNVQLGPKRLELLHNLLPGKSAIAALVNPTNPNSQVVSRDLEAGAKSLGIKLQVLHASSDTEIDSAFATMQQQHLDGVIISPDSLFLSRCAELSALAARYALPAIHAYPEFAAAGGLMSYAGSLADGFHQGGIYTARILAGEKPADLPVQQSTTVELIINLKTAKALGIDIPLPLLGRADEVIE